MHHLGVLKSEHLTLWKRKVLCKINILKFGTKIYNLGTFGCIFKTIAIFEAIFQTPNFRAKIKINLKFGTKISYLGVFRMQFYKFFVVFEITTLEFVQNEFVTRVHFSEGPGSAFSEAPDLGPGRYYKGALYMYILLEILMDNNYICHKKMIHQILLHYLWKNFF